MNVLHISHHDLLGGSGHSANRIYTRLKKIGINSKMFVCDKTTRDNSIGIIRSSKILRAVDYFFKYLQDKLSLQYFFFPSSFYLLRHPWFREADIIQLYNIHGNYFSYTVLPLMSKKKKMVWRLSDMWAMTGHCSYSYDCERWKTGCGNCPYLKEVPELSHDTSALLWKIKRSIYKHSKLTIVAPSKWLANHAKKSPLLNQFPIYFIPNGVDTSVFKLIPKNVARKILGIDETEKVILFTAEDISEKRKGFQILTEALLNLSKENNNVTLLVAGNSSEIIKNQFSFKIKTINYLHDLISMAIIYSSADVFVHPSLTDNLPNVILESMACGTPVVAFNTGGIPEIVKHLETGYLVKYLNVNDLAEGINLLLEKDELRARLSKNCRQLIEREFTIDLEIKRYSNLYAGLINEKND